MNLDHQGNDKRSELGRKGLVLSLGNEDAISPMQLQRSLRRSFCFLDFSILDFSVFRFGSFSNFDF
jgi:hypothetical protein